MTYQFNRETITPSYTKCNRTPSSRDQQARELAEAMARCKVKPTVVPGFTGVAPRPLRSDRVDPETRLKRKAYGLSTSVRRDMERQRMESERFREMADGLEAGL